MKLHAALLLPFLSLALANPLPQTDNPDAVLVKRADKWCRVFTGDGPVACRRGAGTGYPEVKKPRIGANERFGVNCRAHGELIGGTKEWDWVPGWGCWVSAHYTRAVTAGDTCERNVPWC